MTSEVPEEVHTYLARFDLLTWALLVRMAKDRKWSINQTLIELVRDGTDEQ